MKKLNLDFLDDLNLEEAAVGSPSLGKIDKYPEPPNHLRLFPDGKIYPSEEFVKSHKLEYQKRNSDKPENGIDFFISTEFHQFTQAFENKGKKAPKILLCSIVSKHLDKVSLFKTTRYNDDDTPKSSVLKQDSSTTGKEIIEMLNEVYGEDIFADGSIYLDLIIRFDKSLGKTSNGIYMVPKKIVRGKHAGKVETVRRENVEFYPVEIVVSSETPKEEKTSAEEIADTSSKEKKQEPKAKQNGKTETVKEEEVEGAGEDILEPANDTDDGLDLDFDEDDLFD